MTLIWLDMLFRYVFMVQWVKMVNLIPNLKKYNPGNSKQEESLMFNLLQHSLKAIWPSCSVKLCVFQCNYNRQWVIMMSQGQEVGHSRYRCISSFLIVRVAVLWMLIHVNLKCLYLKNRPFILTWSSWNFDAHVEQPEVNNVPKNSWQQSKAR